MKFISAVFWIIIIICILEGVSEQAKDPQYQKDAERAIAESSAALKQSVADLKKAAKQRLNEIKFRD